jgi:hypothetical protein
MIKDTLFLTSPQFNTVKKDQLYYDRFEYSMGFQLTEVSCLRTLDHVCIDEMIQRRRAWREIARQRWTGQKTSTIVGKAHRELTDETVENLHALAEMLITTPQEFKLVVSINQAYVYTNDLTLINRLNCMPALEHKTFAQAQVTRPKNTVALKRPQHQLRTYFRLTKLSIQQKDHLEAFLLNCEDHVRISPALKEWLAFPYTRLQDYFFVDHDAETWLTMLNLVTPGIIRKTMHIIPAK